MAGKGLHLVLETLILKTITGTEFHCTEFKNFVQLNPAEPTQVIRRQPMFKTGTRLFAAALLSSLVGLASAADFPDRAITVVTPFPAGGATDALTRVLTDHMGKTLGQSLIVENRAGAATTIGASYAARANPDGYTVLLATNSTLVTNRYLYKSLSYD